MRAQTTINIARDFSAYPSGRTVSDGPNSGERFRNDVLLPKLKNLRPGEKLVIELDDVMGYPSSFSEEAFGGVVRKKHFSAEEFLNKLQLVCEADEYNSYRETIIRHIKNAGLSKETSE